ncbi:protein kinase C-binding protein NELL2-like isoform X2 [Anneissia japonica]|uniref:protein kinase C-binding protein NELL2-like isoform X2 n=1 Tax=Anneissia japonica TaxID=1529436 RepID=UPI0014259D43|nr:protein kinase C-binding protein NELL2-like isoform X2 [Anneissia japonica]
MVTSHESIAGCGFGIDSRVEIDLIESVLFNLGDVIQVPGTNSKEPALLFEENDKTRRLNVSSADLEKAQRLLLNAKEYTLMGSFKQTSKSQGTLIAISAGSRKFMELLISSKRNEVRFFYTHQNKIYSEEFEQEFPINEWHKVALSVSGSHITLYVDCEKVAERRILVPDTDIRNEDLNIWLGQRGPSKLHFTGIVQQIKIVVANHGFLHQCPELDRNCPTCGEYLSMVGMVTDLEEVVQKLQHQLNVAEGRLSALEMCGCVQSCTVNDVTYQHGNTWIDRCDNCTCSEGKVFCGPMSCPEPKCKNPVVEDGECCPVCKDHCIYGESKYDHLERMARKGSRCLEMECLDGSMSVAQTKTACPQVSCEPEDSISRPSDCCTYCQGHDYCATANCPSDKVCLNTDFGHQCICQDGFKEENEMCIEIDECEKAGGGDGHHCNDGTSCANTIGSYVCQCLAGYQREDAYSCSEINECEIDGTCGRNSICSNTVGSFMCECEDGYEGDGIICLPICSPPCMNGGMCSAPDTCVCPEGFKGDQCETDIDECKGNHGCRKSRSFCVNLPGSYYCHCKQGYASSTPDNNKGAGCVDVDECDTSNGMHSCPTGTTCKNERGSYSCQCNEDSCSRNCMYGGQQFKDQASWQLDACHSCICDNGVTTCSKILCDCTSSPVDTNCCPECADKGKCLHQELGIIYEHDDTWQYACQKCKCQNSTITCVAKPCPRLSCENTYTPYGDCCPRCQEHHECSTLSSKTTGTASCQQGVATFEHKERWFMDNDRCSECTCLDGNVCCMYSSACTP